jgi:PAS domain-containing protein
VGIDSLSSIATPVAVGVGVIMIGVLLLIRERRTNSSGTELEPQSVEPAMRPRPPQIVDRSPARALLDALDEAVLHVDHSGVIIEVNRAGSDLLGSPVNSIVGSPFDTWLDDEDRGALDPWITRLPDEVSHGHGGPHTPQWKFP